MTYKNYQQMINQIQNKDQVSRAALVAAEDEHSLEAVFLAHKERIVEPILIGNEQKILKLISNMGITSNNCKIVDVGPDGNPAKKAVELAHEGQADFLMKGKIETATLLKAVVDKKNGLQTGQLMSHLAIFELPSYHKLLVISDGGMIPYPNLAQKKQIIENVVTTLGKMGYKAPKIAVLAGVEKVNPKMQETADAEELKKMNESGEISDCFVVGPISYDLAMSKEAARIKGYTCSFCGDFDVLIVPNLAAGNILSKALILNGEAKMAGMVLGAKVPIVLSSRGASTEEKYLSLVLSAAAAQLCR